MKRIIILLICVIAVGVISVYLLQEHAEMQTYLPQTFETQEEPADPEEPVSLEISFSKAPGFYDTDISIELSCADENAVIYYTTNGNEPTTGSKKYAEPIAVKSRSRVNATTIRAIAVSGDNKSEIVNKSYVTGKKVFERFDPTTLVFVLSTDNYNLYDYYHGIATEGYKRDEYVNSDKYTGNEADYELPANWTLDGRESERDMYVEAFDSDGKLLISQAAGARVVGGASRATSQKSWRLYARNSYSEGNGKFKYPFFTGAVDNSGNFITRYDRLTLRNNGNDREFAAVRDELSMTLSAQAGFPDTQNVRPAAVFLNGQYYGFSWLHETYCNDYLATQYGGSKDNFRIVGTKEKDVEGDDERCVADWNNVLETARRGLTDEENFRQFCELVDIDNFMLYYAIQIYIDNKDWPGNNYKAWRYYPAEGENVSSKFLDGKWRFLLFDAEFAWGLYGRGYADRTLSNVLSGNHMQGSSELLNRVLERPDMKEKFANTVCDLIGGSFAEENVLEALEKLIDESNIECNYALSNGYTSSWANEWTFNDSRTQIKDFAKNRPNVMLRNIEKEFLFENKFYSATLNCPTGASAKLNSQTASSSKTVSAKYYKSCKVPISATPFDGFEFDHWEINGKEYDAPEMTLDSSMADEKGEISILLYLKKTESKGGIYISELYTAGEGDWIEFYNPSDTAARLSGYLSDSIDELEKWEIPQDMIPPRSVLTIACKNNDQPSALKKHRTNFSLKSGETLYYSDKEGNIISRITVVDMAETQSLTKRIDGKYRIGTVSEGVHIEE